MRSLHRVVATSSAVLLCAFGVVAISTSAAQAAVPAADADIHISEVFADGGASSGADAAFADDFIELTNTGSQDETLTGWLLKDDTDAHDYPIADGTVIPAGGQVAFDVDDATHTGSFGLGKGGDAARVYDGTTLVDQFWFGAAAGDGKDFSRCSIGSGAFATVVTTGITPGAVNDCPTPAAALATVKAQVKVNEVLADGTGSGTSQQLDAIELYNSGTTSVPLAGWWLSDDKAGDKDVLPAGTVIAPVGITGSSTSKPVDYLTYRVGASATSTLLSQDIFLDNTGKNLPGNTDFGIGKGGDNAALIAPDGTDADRVSFGSDANAVVAAPATGNTISRCPDGTGSWAVSSTATLGAANSCGTGPTGPPGSTSGYGAIRVSEIETNGDPLGDWIELTNTGDTAVNISGLYLADDGGSAGDVTVFPTDASHSWQIPGTNQNPADTTTAGNTVLAAHGYQAFFESNTFPFGLGGPDEARIFSPTKALIDSTSWPQHESGATYVRCPGVTQGVVFTDTADQASFVNSSVSTPNAANDCTPPIRINEVQASDPGGGPDWVELTNVGSQPVDLSGWVLTDDKDTDGDVIPSGTTLNPGAFLAFDPNNEDGKFTNTTPASKPFGLGATGDEVRVYQAGAWSGSAYVAADLVDAFVFEDASGKSGGAVQSQTVLADGVTKAGGPWPVDTASPSSPETYARCSDGISQVVADGTGAWQVTNTPTEGGSNRCDGLFAASPWPDTHDNQAVNTADNVDLGQNVSGLFYVGGDPTTTSDDYMWAIANGSSGLAGANPGDSGNLYKLVKDASGNWGPATGWTKGVPVRFLDNTTGEPDSEAVTAVNGDVFVTSERDNTNSDVSKIAVIEVDPNKITQQNGDADGDLNAVNEWDLGSELGPINGQKNPETGIDPANPGDANLGLEALTYVPDSYLTSVGFKDEHTGAAYNPADYPNHIDNGVFVAGLEKTGKLYAYVLNTDGSFTRVATIDTGFQTIQDLLWDPSQDALWATCDNGCQGRSSIIKVVDGSFAVQTVYSRPLGATANLNNEGFTVAPISECVNGSRSAYWSDDSDDGGHWLRTASVDCTADTTKPVITVSPTPPANANGWNNSSVTVAFSCTDSGAGVDAAHSSLGNQVLTASGTVTATCVDNAGNTATASYTAKIDTVAPVVTYTGNKTTYGILDSVAIGCTASDAGSGLASPTCAGASGPAWSFGPGARTLSAQVVDLAGNTGSGSTTFTVTVKPADLAKLTTQFVTSSAKYQASNVLAKLVVAVLVSVPANVVLGLAPTAKPAVKAQLIALYKSELAVLVSSGYLTAAQQSTLIGLAAAV